MSSNAKKPGVLAQSVYLIIWLGCILWYWLSLIGGSTAGGAWIMGYTIFVFYLILPLASLVASAVIANSERSGRQRLIAPCVFAALYVVAELLTFGLSTAQGLTNIALPDLTVLPIAIAPGLAGLAVGSLVAHIRQP